MDKVNVSISDYGYGGCEKKELDAFANDLAVIPDNTIRWIHISGQADLLDFDSFCAQFDFHPLIKKDILEQHLRPKIDDYDSYIFTTMNAVNYDKKEKAYDFVKISIILGNNYVITHCEDSPEIFRAVKNRMEKYSTHIQRHGADFLYYFIIDTLMESYFSVLEDLTNRADEFEDETIANPTKESLHDLQHLRKQTLYLNKTFWPLREILSYLERGDTLLISAPIKTYMRGLYENIIQIIETTEELRDLLSGVMDIYLSSISNKMNEVMKVLTIISTIFIPLSFIASVYGMNLQQPEYSYPYSYPIVLGVMLLIVIGMLTFFKKKKWW